MCVSVWVCAIIYVYIVGIKATLMLVFLKWNIEPTRTNNMINMIWSIVWWRGIRFPGWLFPWKMMLMLIGIIEAEYRMR